ncbi:MAG: DUF885 domain-containing protein [Actinomycetia bacterium]|nr:DUF885 domain-containing protein [Actinomycetes bacterium]MCP5032713.1 DUF885 domain-containing protein [Actinomycetes bacterium]
MTELFDLSDRAVNEFVAADPLLGTYSGVAGHDHRWPDMSPEGHAESVTLHRAMRDEALATTAETSQDRLAQRVLVDYCDDALAAHDAALYLTDLNNIDSPHQTVRQVFDVHAADSAEDWESILTRLETINEPLDGYRLTLESGLKVGHIASRRQVEAVVEQGTMAAGPDSSFGSLRRRLAEASVDSARYKVRLDAAIDGARSAYADLNRWLTEQYAPHAGEADGVGEERYRASSRMFLGTELDLHATYRWAWDEVERLWAELERVCAKIDSGCSVLEVYELLSTDPARVAGSADEFIALMQERQETALRNLDGTHFDVPDEIRAIDVLVEPAGGALAAHYLPPSEDFSRAGSVWYPIEGMTSIPIFKEITTAYHEGFPGHHLQVGVQATQQDQLSRFHRMLVWYPGSGEGWALYAEHLMGELGYLELPDYQVGLLSSQMLRALRVVIDIGVHLDLAIPDDVSFHPGEPWTYDVAYDLLAKQAGEGPATAQSEVVRYFGWPGQASSYKVGEQAILDLRAEQQKRPDFDLKTFHANVLAVGSIGLDLLRHQIALA